MGRKTSEEKYILTLTKEQALTVSKACEFYSRVMMGQFGEIAYETMMQSIKQDDFCARREMMEDLLFQARRLAFPDLMGRGHSYGIGHNESADRAWNAYQALRYAVAWHEHQEGGITVDFQKPYPAGGEPVPDCKVEASGSASQYGDMISRTALIQRMKQVVIDTPLVSQIDVQTACETLEAIVDVEPSIEAESVQHGYWIPDNHACGYYMSGYICSRCKQCSLEGGEFCHKCGAKMDAEAKK